MKFKYVSIIPLRHTVRQCDVSFPDKLPNIVATRGEVCSLQFTKYRFAAGLRRDSLGPNPLTATRGAYLSVKQKRRKKENLWPNSSKTKCCLNIKIGTYILHETHCPILVNIDQRSRSLVRVSY